MLAEFFAANGADADAVLVLGKTDHQDALVRVVLAAGEEQLGDFDAYLRRPSPLISGMVARFFGEDGTSADRISALSLSRFVDTNVGITVTLVKRPDGSAAESPTPVPTAKGPYAASAALLWRSGFPARPEVWAALGDEARADRPDIDAKRRWCWDRLKVVFSLRSVAELDPQRLIAWAAERDLVRFLPKQYGAHRES